MVYEKLKNKLRAIDGRIIKLLSSNNDTTKFKFSDKGPLINLSGSVQEIVNSIEKYDQVVLRRISYAGINENSTVLRIYVNLRSKGKRSAKLAIKRLKRLQGKLNGSKK